MPNLILSFSEGLLQHIAPATKLYSTPSSVSERAPTRIWLSRSTLSLARKEVITRSTHFLHDIRNISGNTGHWLSGGSIANCTHQPLVARLGSLKRRRLQLMRGKATSELVLTLPFLLRRNRRLASDGCRLIFGWLTAASLPAFKWHPPLTPDRNRTCRVAQQLEQLAFIC